LKSTHFDISLHIRRGDKKTEAARVPTDGYVIAINLIQKLIGKRPTVFVCTDDEGALEEIKTIKGIRLYYLNDHYRKYNRFLALKRFGDKVGLQTLADIVIATQSTYLIGSWSSNVERLSMELRGTKCKKASNPFLEVGKTKCVSVAHCALLNLQFESYYRREWI
jgi:kynurenine formamidase